MLSMGTGDNSIRGPNVEKQQARTNRSDAMHDAEVPTGTLASHGARCDMAVLTAILDHLSLPILLVDGNFVVHYANAAAHGGTASEPATVVLEHTFLGLDRKEAARLRSAIADTCTSGTGHAIVMRSGHAKPAVAVTIPFSNNCPDGHRALVLVRNGIRFSKTLAGSLRELFNLSLAEAEVAIAFGSGAAINDVARDRGVTRNTLRSQLASIMERTDTHRQGELVALITRIDTLVWTFLVLGSVFAFPALTPLQDLPIA